MPIRVGWFIQGHVILTETWGHLTKSEYLQGTAKSADMIYKADGEHPIHVIVDQTRMISQPNLQDLASGETANQRQGWILVAMQDNPFQKFQTSVTAQKFKFETRFVSNRDEAVRVIETTVPDTKGKFPNASTVDWLLEVDEQTDQT